MQRNPELRLSTTHRPIGIHDLQLREQRALIEIHDVLQRTPVPAGPGRGPDALAGLLVADPPGPEAQVTTQPASTVLRPSADYEGDRAQILALAKAWGTHDRTLTHHRLRRRMRKARAGEGDQRGRGKV